MGFAEAADVTVALVGDIDRGGVIASLVGTMALLSPSERARIAACIINRFRGDVRLFDSESRSSRRRTGLPCLGVVPWFEPAKRLPAEDSVSVGRNTEIRPGATLKIAVPVLSRISNFDDLDPLIAEPGVEVRFVEPGRALPGDADLVVLPGSKATIGDMRFLRSQGWDVDIQAHLRRGGWLLGLCGGYQMLGRTIRDRSGIEGEPGEEPGLGVLDLHTELAGAKRLAEASGTERLTGQPVRGYEMHIGETTGPALSAPMLDLNGRADGTVSADGKVMGCYLHGLFASDAFRAAFLQRLNGRATSGLAWERQIDSTLDAPRRAPGVEPRPRHHHSDEPPEQRQGSARPGSRGGIEMQTTPDVTCVEPGAAIAPSRRRPPSRGDSAADRRGARSSAPATAASCQPAFGERCLPASRIITRHARRAVRAGHQAGGRHEVQAREAGGHPS